MPITEHRMSNTEYQRPNTKFRLPSTQYRILNTEYQIPSTYFLIIIDNWITYHFIIIVNFDAGYANRSKTRWQAVIDCCLFEVTSHFMFIQLALCLFTLQSAFTDLHLWSFFIFRVFIYFCWIFFINSEKNQLIMGFIVIY